MAVKNAFILPHPPIVVPEVGRGEEKKLRETTMGFQKIAQEIANIKPDTIVISSPHAAAYSDYINVSSGGYATGSLENFGAAKVNIKADYDEEFVKKIVDMASVKDISAGILGKQGDSLDHGVLIPLYFLNKYYSDYKLVRIGISGLSLSTHYQFGKVINKVSEELGRNTVFIASGDLSHKLLPEGPYGFSPEGPIFDKKIGEIVKSTNFLEFFDFEPEFLEEAAECGLRSFVIMAGVLDGKSVKSKLLSLEGPFGVGYATACFKVVGNDISRQFDKIYEEKKKREVQEIRENEDPWVRLARHSLETYIRENKYADLPENLPKELLTKRAGVFVTIYKNGKLRGCIGTIEPTKNSVAEEILQNAISSGTGDPRFPKVRESELKDLVYSVDVLGEPEEISSIEELNTSRYGLIVSSGRKRGLLLPNIKGVNTPEEQLEIVREKAGIYEGEAEKLERFEVVRHK